MDAANNSITDEDLVIGVLSGGGSFFGVSSILGTTSFYQPLALYWEYIAAANPYRYVSAVAGDGNWEDSNHWVSLLDPNYRIIDADGNIVNGVPTTPELGLDGTDGDFGLVCVEGITAPALGPDECVDLATGAVSPSGVPAENNEIPGSLTTAGLSNNLGWADAVSVNNLIGSVNDGSVEGNITTLESSTVQAQIDADGRRGNASGSDH